LPLSAHRREDKQGEGSALDPPKAAGLWQPIGFQTLRLCWAWLALLLVLPALALAQATPAPAPAAAPAPGLTAEQVQQVLAVLQDDAKRAQFIAVLQNMARLLAPPSAATAAPATPGQPAVAGAAAVPGLPIPLAPDSLGAQVLVGASQHLSSLSGDLVENARELTDFPLISRWVVHLATDRDSQHDLLDTGWKLALVMAIGLAVERLVRFLLRRPAASLEALAPNGRPPPQREAEPAPTEAGIADAEAGQTEQLRRTPSMLTLLHRLVFVLARFVLDLLPVLAVAAVGYSLAGTRLAEPTTTRLVILAVLNAYVLVRLVTSVTRLLVAPESPRLRLLHLSDAAAQYILSWVRRIAVVSVFGYAITEVGLLFGLYRVAHDALLKLVMLAVYVFLIVIVLQQRALVAGFIAARPEATGPMAALRNRFARRWHIVAIFYLLALWLVWAFHVPHGFSRLLYMLVAAGVISGFARLAVRAALGAVDRALHVGPELAARYPGLEMRARRYHPVARRLVTGAISAVALLLLLQIWGVDALSWFASGALGGRLLSALLIVGITLLAALTAWEVANAAIQRHLARLARDAQAVRVARLRTLLPMFRTALLIGIFLFVGLIVLSEIGVNIAPVLAGAGVVGLAIGFGSQKLVQDVITGLFLLLENTMQVGDVVSLGGLSGTVENLSVRTIRLRALDGAVHTVPFSAVTTVTNMTRDFSYALLDIGVGLNEEPDHVIDVVHALARDMRNEPRWAGVIRDDLDVMGVEKFIDTAWVLRVRIKTLPGQRWAVERELNRRIKYRFDELAIESPITSYRVLGTQPPAPAPAPEPPPADAGSSVQA
jgi:small-conductance mechanosensitive channel